MRNILKKLCISISGNNFHRKLALHLLIIRDRIKIKLRRLTKAVLNSVCKAINNLRNI